MRNDSIGDDVTDCLRQITGTFIGARDSLIGYANSEGEKRQLALSNLVVEIVVFSICLGSCTRFEVSILGWPPQDGNGPVTPIALEPFDLVWSPERWPSFIRNSKS